MVREPMTAARRLPVPESSDIPSFRVTIPDAPGLRYFRRPLPFATIAYVAMPALGAAVSFHHHTMSDIAP